MTTYPFTILAAVALACAPPTAARTEPRPAATPSASTVATLAAALAEDMAPERGMPWSAARRLRWTDFRGRAPVTGNVGARTAYGLYYAWGCRGEAFAFHVVAALHPLRSWVKPIVVGDVHESTRVLRHEQTHFDLTEVYARRIRQRFEALSGACGRTDDELRALARQLVDEEKDMQRRYDRETHHGLIANRQNAWTADVARMLSGSARYAQ